MIKCKYAYFLMCWCADLKYAAMQLYKYANSLFYCMLIKH
jgi:hypothetical protein